MQRPDLAQGWRRGRHAIAATVREAATLGHVLAVLATVEVLVRRVSLLRLSRLVGVRLDLTPRLARAEPMAAADLPARARRQLRCTNRVADAWPFSKGPCLRRSLVAGHLLRGLRPALRLGVTGSDAAMVAHAWLEIDGRPLEDVSAYQMFGDRPTTESA